LRSEREAHSSAECESFHSVSSRSARFRFCSAVSHEEPVVATAEVKEE